MPARVSARPGSGVCRYRRQSAFELISARRMIEVAGRGAGGDFGDHRIERGDAIGAPAAIAEDAG